MNDQANDHSCWGTRKNVQALALLASARALVGPTYAVIFVGVVWLLHY